MGYLRLDSAMKRELWRNVVWRSEEVEIPRKQQITGYDGRLVTAETMGKTGEA